MLKVIKNVKKTLKRYSSLKNTIPGFLKELKEYKSEEDILKNNNYKTFESLYKQDQIIEEDQKIYEEYFTENLFQDVNLSANIIKKYFSLRKKLGFNEKILSQCLDFLVKHKNIRGDIMTTGDDIMGKRFFESNLWKFLLKDINLLLHPKMELDSKIFINILKNLRELGFKDLDFVKNSFFKIEKKLGIEREGYEKNFDLEFFEDVLKEDEHNFLQDDKLKNYLTSILNIKNRNYEKTENTDKNNLELRILNNCLNEIGFYLEKVNTENLELFDSIEKIRTNYISLKEDQKSTILKNNPELLLDFLQLEDSLISTGLIMPRDLLDENNSKETLDLVNKKVLTESNLNPEILDILIKINEKKKERIEISDLIQKGKINEKNNFLECMMELVFLGVEDIENYEYKNTYVNDVFRNFLKEEISKSQESFNNRKLKEFENYYTGKADVVGIYYYTQIFNFLKTEMPGFFEKLNFEDLNKRNLLLYHINNKILMNVETEGNFDFSNLENQDILYIITNYNYFKPEFLLEIVNKNKDSLLNIVQKTLESFDTKIEDKISLVNFLIFLSEKFDFDNSLVKNAVTTFLNQDNLLESNNTYRNSTNKKDYYYNFWKISQFTENENISLSKNDRNLLKKSLMKMNLYMDLDYEAKMKKDPIHYSLLHVLKKNLENDLNFDKFFFSGLKRNIPKYYFPHVLNIFNNEVYAIYLLRENEDQNSNEIILREKLIKKVFLREKSIEVNFKYIKISEFMKDKNYFQNFNFDIKMEDSEIHKILNKLEIIKKNELLEEVGNLFKSNSESNISLLTIEYFISKILEDINKMNLNNNFLYDKYNQLKFFLVIFQDLTKNENCKNLIEKIDKKLSILKNETDKKVEFDFIGKRYGIQKIDNLQNYLQCKETEFLNYNLFKNTEYFIFESWKNNFENLSSINLTEDWKLTQTKYGLLKKTLIPSLKGREITTLNGLSIFWNIYENEDITLDTKKKFENYDSLIENNENFDLLHNEDKFRLSLLNMAYEFRSLENYNDFFYDFFNLKFWEKIMRLKNEKTENDFFNMTEYQVLNKGLFEKKTLYKNNVEKLVERRKELDYWQNLVDIEIPEKYNEAMSKEEKSKYKDIHSQAKLNYHKLLLQYKEEITDNRSVFSDTDYKDVINTVNYKNFDKKENGKIILSSLNNDNFENNIINSLLKTVLLYKKNFDLEFNEVEKSLFEEYKKKIKSSFLEKSVNFDICIGDEKIGDVFGEEDFEFFEKYFPSSEMKIFENEKIINLFGVLNLFFNEKISENFEKELFIESTLSEKNKNLNLEIPEDSIKKLFTNKFNNKEKFDLDKNENFNFQNTMKISEKEKEIYKEMLSIERGKIKRKF